MFPPAMNLPSRDYWTGEQSAFSSGSSPEKIGSSGNPMSSDSCGRSLSPLGGQSPTENNPFKFDSFLPRQQSYDINRRASVPYSRQQVTHFPGAFNPAWTTPMPQQTPGFGQPYPPQRMYVFEAPRCCTSPRVRVIHECCNKESTAREVIDEPAYPRRSIPTASKMTLCRFCLKNGEPPSVYYTHNLHSDDGRVACPVLRRYDCPICNNGGGDYAHTVRYCPFVRNSHIR